VSLVYRIIIELKTSFVACFLLFFLLIYINIPGIEDN